MTKKKKETKAVAVVENKTMISFDNEQISLIKSQIAVGATDDELKLFLYHAKKTGLDPLARQIYCIKRKTWNKDKNGYDEKMTIQSSIDGFRVVAERSGDYAGQDEPEFVKGEDGDLVCKVRVYKWRGEQRFLAATGVAYWKEYCQMVFNKETKTNVPGPMWKKMPHVMLSKVAEALALRKAFPQDLSGLYTSEEMSQADVEDGQQKTGSIAATGSLPKTNITPKATKEQKTEILKLAEEFKGWNTEETVKFLTVTFHLKDAGELNTNQANSVIVAFKKKLDEAKKEIEQNKAGGTPDEYPEITPEEVDKHFEEEGKAESGTVQS